MPLFSEAYHFDKLNKKNINVKTKYIVGNKILERNTNGKVNDDIINGIRCKKEYFLDDRCIHSESIFDSRIEYTFISNDMENEEYICKNCGFISKISNFLEGCPYCGTSYNVEYFEKDLGSKYHYDIVLTKKSYKIVTGIIDIIMSLLMSFLFIKYTSRTFNNYDVSKIFIYGGILSLILYYFFYIIDAYIVISPIKMYKDKQNKKQIDFWNSSGIDKKKFFNNLNYEIDKKYYLNDNIIDYDILDYINFKKYTCEENLYVEVKVYIRIVYLKDGKIKSKTCDEIYKLKKNKEFLDIKSGINNLKCKNCGASVNIKNGKCMYCGEKIKYTQEWIIE